MTTPAAAPTAIAPTNGASAPAAPTAPSPNPPVPAATTAPAAAAPAAPAGPSVKWKVADIQAAIAAAGEGATEAEVFSLLKGYKHRVKVDGQETEVPFEEMVRHAGLGKKARAEIAKVRELETKLEESKTALHSIAQRMLDPRQAEPILEKNWGGPDAVYDWAKNYVARQDQYRALPPEERARLDRMTQAQREHAARERQLAEREARIKAQEQAEAKRRHDGWVARISRDSPPVFASMGLPNEPKLIQEATRRTIRLLENAGQKRIPMTPDEARREAVDSIMAGAKALFTGLKPEVLRSLVGEEGLSAVQQANLARVENQPGRTTPAASEQPRGENGQFRKDHRIEPSGRLGRLK